MATTPPPAPDEQPGIAARYFAKFGEMPPEMYSDPRTIDALMEDAIKRGRALTVEDVQRGSDPIPPDAVV